MKECTYRSRNYLEYWTVELSVVALELLRIDLETLNVLMLKT